MTYMHATAPLILCSASDALTLSVICSKRRNLYIDGTKRNRNLIETERNGTGASPWRDRNRYGTIRQRYGTGTELRSDGTMELCIYE